VGVGCGYLDGASGVMGRAVGDMTLSLQVSHRWKKAGGAPQRHRKSRPQALCDPLGITGAKKECSPFSRRGGAEDREEFKKVLQRQNGCGEPAAGHWARQWLRIRTRTTNQPFRMSERRPDSLTNQSLEGPLGSPPWLSQGLSICL
jgi:hypothetical protein